MWPGFNAARVVKGEGNPNHGPDGKFASAPGGGSSIASRARESVILEHPTKGMLKVSMNHNGAAFAVEQHQGPGKGWATLHDSASGKAPDAFSSAAMDAGEAKSQLSRIQPYVDDDEGTKVTPEGYSDEKAAALSERVAQIEH